jgi:hypothetical protein
MVVSWSGHRPLSCCRHLVSVSTARLISVTPDDTAKQTTYSQASHIPALKATQMSVKLILRTLTSYRLSSLLVSVALHSACFRIRFYLVMAEVKKNSQNTRHITQSNMPERRPVKKELWMSARIFILCIKNGKIYMDPKWRTGSAKCITNVGWLYTCKCVRNVGWLY